MLLVRSRKIRDVVEGPVWGRGGVLGVLVESWESPREDITPKGKSRRSSRGPHTGPSQDPTRTYGTSPFRINVHSTILISCRDIIFPEFQRGCSVCAGRRRFGSSYGAARRSVSSTTGSHAGCSSPAAHGICTTTSSMSSLVARPAPAITSIYC